MEGSRGHRGACVAALVVGLLSPSARAVAVPNEVTGPDESWGSVTASTDAEKGSVLYEAEDGARLTSQGVRRGGGRQCVGMTEQQAVERWGEEVVLWVYTTKDIAGQVPRGRDWESAVRYIVVCNGQPTSYGWYVPRPRPAGSTVQELARRVRDEIPMPGVEIRANPGVGVAGMEAWFWAEGYSGLPILEQRDVLGRTIEVEAAPARYLWDFGDGTPPVETATLGLAYPDRSDIRHVYEGMSGGFPVQVRFLFDVRYRVDGGDWIRLAPIERTAAASYRVGEIRTVVTSRG